MSKTQPGTAKSSRVKTSRLPHRNGNGLAELALRACLIASDAASNTKEFLASTSRLAFLAVRDCEKELDRIEQQMDEQLPSAITHVSEPEARELLACLRFSNDLERIGDLLWGVAQRVHNLETPLPKLDSEALIQMLEVLETMLQRVRQGFVERDLDPASYVLRADREIDATYKSLFRRHVQDDHRDAPHAADALLMAQALERAGDHATNLAEELFRLIEGRSLRHVPKRQLRD
ncbi:MAG TPA: PhoU domain-containing protein [Terriglobales bacterium]|nr:PhoU domain-containing protein [Terriglobales bacterium]